MGQPGEFSSLSGSNKRDSEIPRLGPARRGGIFAATGRRLSAWPAVGPPPSDADSEPNVAADVEIPHQIIHLVLRRCPTPPMVGNLVVVFQCSACISMALPASGLRDAVLVFRYWYYGAWLALRPRYPRERSGFSAALTNGDGHWYQTSKSGGNRTEMAIERQRRCGTSHAAARRPRWHAREPSPL